MHWNNENVIPRARDGRLARLLVALTVAFAGATGLASAQEPRAEATARVPQEPDLGRWDEALDWGLPTCAGDAYVEEDICHTDNCLGLPWGELVHAQLYLQNPTAYAAAPDTVEPEWRVMLVDTGSFDTTEQAWRVWDPKHPTELIEGDPKLPLTIFCAGHTALADGKLLWVGGQRWPAAGHGSCLPWGSPYGFVYDPEAEPLGALGPGGWVRIPDMIWPRYYPTPVLLPDGTVMVVAGNVQPPHFEVYDPYTNSWAGQTFAFTNKPCPTIYPRVHLLPALDPALSTGTLISTGPFLLDQIDPPFLCGGEPDIVGIQRHFLLPGGFAEEPLWGSSIAPAVEPNRAEASSVVIVDTTVEPVSSRVVFGAGKETAFFGEVFGSVEMIVDGHTLAGRSIPMPSLKYPRFYQLFVLLPGQRILAVGGEDGHSLRPAVKHPELLDLKNLEAGWQVLPPHDYARVYHSWALLLPDGRVLHGGGRSVVDKEPYRHAQVFNPAYLPDPEQGETRPVFGRGNSALMGYGRDFDVRLASAGAGIASFELLRPGASTHANDFEQRLVILPFEHESGTQYTVRAPARGDIAPPGWYMLFAVDEDGVPSEAHWVRLGHHPVAETAAEAERDVSAPSVGGE